MRSVFGGYSPKICVRGQRHGQYSNDLCLSCTRGLFCLFGVIANDQAVSGADDLLGDDYARMVADAQTNMSSFLVRETQEFFQ